MKTPKQQKGIFDTTDLEGEKEYNRFQKFWEHSRDHIVDAEDGDKFLDWDKSNIGHFCFNEGIRQERQRLKEEVRKAIDKLQNKWRDDIEPIYGQLEELKKELGIQ